MKFYKTCLWMGLICLSALTFGCGGGGGSGSETAGGSGGGSTPTGGNATGGARNTVCAAGQSNGEVRAPVST